MKARLYPGVETLDGGVYRRSLVIDGQIGLVAVSQGKGNWLDVRVKLQNLTLLPKVIARVREAFDFAADPEVIGTHLSQDESLQDFVRRRPGLRVPGAFESFEIGIRAILGQQITVTAAIKLGASLVSHLGESLPSEWARKGGVSRLFPSAEAILASSLDFLGMPQARVRCLKAYCAAFLAEPELFGRDTAEVVSRLRAVPGIGPWTASYIALRALRDPDAFPAEDVALARGMLEADGARPSREALEKRSQAWRPWRAYAAQHIWTELASG